MLNKIRSSIELKLSIHSLAEYADGLIYPYVIQGIYLDMDQLAKERLVTEVVVNPNITTEAYIAKKDNHFTLTTKHKLDKSLPVDNFLLAHEISHTFLYEIKSGRILDKYLFVKSSPEQEYFCDFFARSLLIPTAEIEKDLKNFNEEMSLKYFNSLASKYNVPYDELLKRILNDLELVKNIVIIRFAKFPNQLYWKVYETFMSESIRHDKNYYIPSHNYNTELKYYDRFPTCSAALSDFLSLSFKQLKPNEELTSTGFNQTSFNEKPLKHFSKNLTPRSSYLISRSYQKKYNTDILNVLIKLR